MSIIIEIPKRERTSLFGVMLYFLQRYVYHLPTEDLSHDTEKPLSETLFIDGIRISSSSIPSNALSISSEGEYSAERSNPVSTKMASVTLNPVSFCIIDSLLVIVLDRLLVAFLLCFLCETSYNKCICASIIKIIDFTSFIHYTVIILVTEICYNCNLHNVIFLKAPPKRGNGLFLHGLRVKGIDSINVVDDRHYHCLRRGNFTEWVVDGIP